MSVLLSCLLARLLLVTGNETDEIAPAFIAITQMWYRRREQPSRLGAWYAMNGVVNMVSCLWRGK